MLSYVFMQRAFIAAICISIALPMIGNVIVLKRLSNIGDALSHSSLAGITLAICFGANSISGAVIACVLSAMIIEFTRAMFKTYPEVSTTIVMSLSVCITAICSSFIKMPLNNFLFGSIVAISKGELLVIISLSLLVVYLMLRLYKPLFAIVFNEDEIIDLPVKTINFAFTLLTAVTIAISAKIIGAFVISSMLVIPTACAMKLSWSYKSNLIIAILFGVLFSITGLILSYYFDLKPGGSIILTGIVVFILLSIKSIWKR